MDPVEAQGATPTALLNESSELPPDNSLEDHLGRDNQDNQDDHESDQDFDKESTHNTILTPWSGKYPDVTDEGRSEA